jgi:hypothetical protein
LYGLCFRYTKNSKVWGHLELIENDPSDCRMLSLGPSYLYCASNECPFYFLFYDKEKWNELVFDIKETLTNADYNFTINFISVIFSSIRIFSSPCCRSWRWCWCRGCSCWHCRRWGEVRTWFWSTVSSIPSSSDALI